MKSSTSPRDMDLPPDLSPSEVASLWMNHNLRGERTIHPMCHAVKEDVVRFIQRFRWKSGLGVVFICCGVICSGYLLFCTIDGGDIMLSTAGAINGYLGQQIFDQMDVERHHLRHRSLLSERYLKNIEIFFQSLAVLILLCCCCCCSLIVFSLARGPSTQQNDREAESPVAEMV